MAKLSGKRVAIIASDHFEEAELVVPRDRLREAGAEVKVYGLSGKPLQAVESDTQPTGKVDVDGGLDDVNPEQVDALVVPGGTVNADQMRVDPTAQQIVKDVMAAGKPVAVVCHGPWLLISSGLAGGRRLTSFPSLEDDLTNAGATWVDEEVVVDGNLITSRNPDDLPAFVDAIEQALAVS